MTVYGINDYKSPYASGSAKVDAYVVCPCSMSTVGTLAAGAMANLIHRAASVALKEGRKLVLVPRETPLSFIHLQGLATLQQAGAVILFAAPGFYHGAETIDDLVDFVVARILDQLGLDNTLAREVGPVTHESGTLPAEGVRTHVRPDRPGLRPDEPRHDRRARPALAPPDRARGRRRAGDRVLDGCCGTGDLAVAARKAGAGEVIGLDFSARMLERARRKEPAIEWIQGDLLELPFEDASFDAATVGFGVRNVADLERGLDELRRVLKPGGRVGILEITRPKGPLKLFYRLWFDVLIPLAGKILPGGKAYTYLPASVRRFPGPDELAELMRGHGFGEVTYRRLGGGIVALHTGTAA